MIIDIENEIYSAIKKELSPIVVLTDYPNVKPTFPCVIVFESDNSTYEDSIDSSGVKHNEIFYTIEIYSTSSTPKTECKPIRVKIDNIMDANYGFVKTFDNEMTNYADENVYRYVLKYKAIIGKDKTIYRN